MNIDKIINEICTQMNKSDISDKETIITVNLNNNIQLDVAFENFSNESWAWLTLAETTADDYIIIATQDTQDLTKDSIAIALEILFEDYPEYF